MSEARKPYTLLYWISKDGKRHASKTPTKNMGEHLKLASRTLIQVEMEGSFWRGSVFFSPMV